MNAETDSTQADLPPAPPAPAPPAPKSRRWVPIVVGVIAVIAVGVVAFITFGTKGETRLEAAFHEARLDNSAWFQLADEGRTIIVDGPMIPDIESDIEFDQPLPSDQEITDAADFFGQLARFYRAVGVPSYVQSQIGTTTSLAGQQAATFDGFEARWSFHPDSGLDITIHEEE